MGFTKALYYPTIDIQDEHWLKNAILFWDEITTIVPSSFEQPYVNRSTQYLSDKGVLVPFLVNPEQDLIEDLTNDTLKYLNTSEGETVLKNNSKSFSSIHNRKLPRDITRLFQIHESKVSLEIRHQLRSNLGRRGWIQVDRNFANFYMTLLANKISSHKHLALLTNNSSSSNLSDLVKLDNTSTVDNYSFRRNYTNKRLAQGLLTNLVIKNINISKTTPLEKIIEFKSTHRDELGLFRTNLSNLTNDIPENISIDALKQIIEDKYNDEFIPSFNNFTKALNGSRIKWTFDNIIKIATIATSTTAVPVLLGLTVPQAIFTSAGISLITSAITYNVDKSRELRENPYSYLLQINKSL